MKYVQQVNHGEASFYFATSFVKSYPTRFLCQMPNNNRQFFYGTLGFEDVIFLPQGDAQMGAFI